VSVTSFSARGLSAFIFLFSLVLSCLIAEGGLRLLVKPNPEMLLERGWYLHRSYLEPDPMLGVRRRANVDFSFPFEEHESGALRFQTNNQGLRRTESTSYEKQPGVKRILALGDSHVDGAVNNEENLTALLEKALDRPGSSRWQVLNAAVGSYSPYQNYLWYRHAGKRYSPDVVLFTFYLGNDLAELAAPERPRLVKRSGRFVELGPTPEMTRGMFRGDEAGLAARLDRYAVRKSYLYSHLRGLTARITVSADPSRDSKAAVDYIGCVAQSLGQISWTSHRKDYDQNLEVFAEILRRMQAEVRGAGAELWLVVLPSRLQIEPELDRDRIESKSRELGLRAAELGFEDRLAEDLARTSRVIDVPVTDLRAGLRAAHQQEEKPLYYRFDWHLNPLGHRVVAELIHSALRNRR